MAANTVGAIESSVQKTHLWLKELTEIGHFADQEQAYTAMRAVLHALRDRLTSEEAVHLGSEMPMVIRGFYFEGWRPSSAPNRQRSVDEFIDKIREGLRGNHLVDPMHAARSTFELLDRRISAGELQDIRRMMPQELRALWPAAAGV